MNPSIGASHGSRVSWSPSFTQHCSPGSPGAATLIPPPTRNMTFYSCHQNAISGFKEDALGKLVIVVSVLVTQSCPTVCDFMDCSPLGFSVHGFFQARILEWVGVSFSRNEVHVPQLLNLCSRACDLQQEKPLQ